MDLHVRINDAEMSRFLENYPDGKSAAVRAGLRRIMGEDDMADAICRLAEVLGTTETPVIGEPTTTETPVIPATTEAPVIADVVEEPVELGMERLQKLGRW